MLCTKVANIYLPVEKIYLQVLDIQKETVYFYNPIEGAEESEMTSIKQSML